MPYIGRNHTSGDHVNNFKVLDDISSYTATFDGTATSVVNTTNDTIRVPEHRFIQGQRVIYTNGGGGNIGGLTTGTAYFIIADTANTFKLAISASNATSSTAINLSSVGTGTSHTINASFDGVNTRFKITHGDGVRGDINSATQLNIAINNVIQRPNINSASFTEGFSVEDQHKIVFKIAPTSNDIFWGNIIANNLSTFDVSDHKIDTFTGDGSSTEFNLSHVPANNESLMVTINGVLQHPSNTTTSRAYTLIASVLKFTTAPANGDEIQVRHLGFAGATTSDVSGFYGRTGNVVLTDQDDITVNKINVGTGVTIESNGQATFVGVVTFGSGSTTIDNNVVNVGTALTLGHTQGLQFHTQNLHSAGFEVNQINSSGIITASSLDISGNASIGGVLTYEDVTNIDSVGIITARNGIDCNADLDVDGHTNLDNVSVAGVVTATTFKSNSVDINGGSIDGTAIGFYNRSHGLFNNVEASGNVKSGHIKVADHIEHSGDSDTMMKFPSSDNISFETAGSERLRIDSNGDVGINETNPTQKLHIGGSIKLTAQLMQSMPADFWSQGNTFIELNGVGNLTHMGSYETCLTSNGYRNSSTQWTSYGINSTTGASQIRLNPTGYIVFGTESNKANGSSHNVTERLRITSGGEVKIADGGLLSVNTNPGSTYGVSEALRIDDGGGTNDRPLQIYEYHHSGSRWHRLQFNTITTTNGSAYTYTQGNYGGSSSIQFHNLGHLIFYTDAQVTGGSQDNISPSERLRITSDGKVGIGTNNPSHELDIESTSPVIEMKDNDAGDSRFHIAQSGAQTYFDMDVGNLGSSSLRFRFAGQEKVRFTTAGKVGINASSPDCMLHVAKASAGTMSADGNAVLALENSNHCVLNMMSPADKSSYIMMGDPDDINAGQIRYDNNIDALMIDVNGDERLRITSSGKVGINETAPLGKLHIKNGDSGASTVGSSTDELVLENNTNTGMTILSATNGEGGICFGDSGDHNIGKLVYSHADNSMQFKTNDSERLRITSTGQVKITGADDQDNFIVDAAQTQFKIHQDSTDGEVSLRAEDGSGNNYAKYMTFFVEGGSGSTERLRITSSGKVGINDSSPHSRLTVTTSNEDAVLIKNTNTAQYASARIHLQGPGSADNVTSLVHGQLQAGGGDSYFAIESKTSSHVYKKTLAIYDHNSNHWAFHAGPEEGASPERLRLFSDGSAEIGNTGTASEFDGLRRLDIINRHSDTDSGSLLRLITRDAGTANTTESFDIVKYRNGNVSMNNNTVVGSVDTYAAGGIRLRVNGSNGKVNVCYDTPGNATYGNLEITKSGVSNADPNWSYLSLHRVGNVAWQQGLIDNDFVIATTGGAARDTIDTGNEKFRIKLDGSVQMTNTGAGAVHCMSNADHGNVTFNNRDGRTLTSNGYGWDGNTNSDGMDPILVLAVENRAGNSDIGDAYGLCLHSESQDDNDYGPLIGWTNRSNSGQYNTTYAAIVGKKTGQAADHNWSAGELHFHTNKPSGFYADPSMPSHNYAGYMNSNPDMRITAEGYVATHRQPAFAAYGGGGWLTASNTKLQFTNLGTGFGGDFLVRNDNYDTANSRFTAPITGIYHFTVGLYLNSNYNASNNQIQSICPRINGSQLSNGHDNIFFFGDRQTSSSSIDGRTISGSLTLRMAKNDYIEVWGRHNITTNWQYYGYHSHFQGFLIG